MGQILPCVWFIRDLLAAEDGNNGCRFFITQKAAAILGDRPSRVLDLPGAGLAAELRDELVQLNDAGGADRVPLRQQAARGVDRNAAAEPRRAGFGGRAALAACTETQVLDLQDFGESRGVMNLRDRHL